MSAPHPSVHIHYLRPPDDEQVFVQDLLLDADHVKVTLARDVPFDEPVRVHDRAVLEPGADAVWFTFPDRWHDIGRFHLADGTFTGLYANILTPPVFEDGGSVWHTTDLFLDLWLDPDGELSVLDREQLARAEREGWVDSRRAERARDEVRRIRNAHAASRWPPTVVEEWPLARALQELEGPREGSGTHERPAPSDAEDDRRGGPT